MTPDLERPRWLASLAALLGLLLLAGCTAIDGQRVAGLGDEEDRDGSGIGGTGIEGVVTGFGSVIVNGLRIATEGDVEITEDGAPATADALALGQVLAIEASGARDDLSTRSIRIRREVLGPIAFIDQAARSVSILGQTIVLPEDIPGESEVSLGQTVAVSGFRLPDGAVVATRVDDADDAGQVHLYGEYRLVEGGAGSLEGPVESSVEIGGFPVRGVSPSPALSGRQVRVRGRLVDGAIIAADLEAEPEIPFGGRVRHLSIAGFVDPDRRTLGRLRLSRLLDDLSRLDLPGGLIGRFGVFEGRWSREGSILDVDRQTSFRDVFRSLVDEDRQEIRQDRRNDRTDRRQDRREERQERRDDRQDRRGDREGGRSRR